MEGCRLGSAVNQSSEVFVYLGQTAQRSIEEKRTLLMRSSDYIRLFRIEPPVTKSKPKSSTGA